MKDGLRAQPRIGITVSLDHGERLRAGHDYLYIKRAYAQAVAQAGGAPLLISPELAPQAVAEICDGLVISGGDDIPPALYGERGSPAAFASPPLHQTASSKPSSAITCSRSSGILKPIRPAKRSTACSSNAPASAKHQGQAPSVERRDLCYTSAQQPRTEEQNRD